ncbi:hypothetical protein CRUP_036064 [Coryphaenoides rupestris]|nr:hypothetical protein CRUP_036064 [Coryphaenoides rupestris]
MMMMMAAAEQGQQGQGEGQGRPGSRDDFAEAIRRIRQMATKVGGGPKLSLINSSAVIDPSLYSFDGQKRSLDNGVGNQLGAMVHQRATTTEVFKVPDKMVGFIIGKGGEQISRLQLESGCKIQIAPDSGGLLDRHCTLTGTPENIDQAKRLLNEIVEQCRYGPGAYTDMVANGSTHQILIPANKVGLVIGKGGETIKQLQVVVPRFAVGIIIGRNGEMIKKIQNDTGVRIQFKQVIGKGGEQISRLQLESGCKIQIAPGGETIKNIKEQSCAHVELQRNPPANTDPNLRIFSLRGTPQQLDKARQLIDERVGVDHNGSQAGHMDWEQYCKKLGKCQQIQGQTTGQEYSKPWGQTAGQAPQQSFISAPDADMCYWDECYNQPTVNYFNQDGQDAQSGALQDD